MKQMAYDIPGIKPVSLAVGAELSLLDFYPAEYNKLHNTSKNDNEGIIQRSDRNCFHIRLGKSFNLPLYQFLFNEQWFIGAKLPSFLAVGADRVDPHYLIELEYFGFPSDRKCLLEDVRMIFPGDEVSVTAEALIWLDDTLPEQPGLTSSLVKPLSEGETLFNLLPKVATSLFSPFDHVFFAQVFEKVETCQESVCEILRESLPKNFGFDRHRADIFNAAHKSRKVEGIDLRGYIRKIGDQLESSWEASDKVLNRNAYMAERFYHPYILFQLSILAAEAGKEIRVVDAKNGRKEETADPVFTMDDNPIVNVYESFQRVFFYGNRWLARIWFFIPPMISAKIIKRQQKYSEGEQHICIYAVTLDYLLRFYPLKVGNVTGD
ncbi:hypothetical protein ACJJID_09250 [Microbulbifer sp. CnH-101-G]|uniref:hypothetical protein n=1 Tax=Microbulbifer sp. CnH-101-G TaxID=3243393 RepID=UPI004039E0EB